MAQRDGLCFNSPSMRIDLRQALRANPARAALAGIICLAAATSLGPEALARWNWLALIRAAAPEARADLLEQEMGALKKAVEQRGVPADEPILLETSLDPALAPYLLFPRTVYKRGPQPESDSQYFDVAPSPFPRRAPEEAPVRWRATVERRADGAISVMLVPNGSPR